MKRSFVFVLALVSAGASLAAYSRTTVPAAVVFHGSGPGGFKIEGKTQVVNINETPTSLIVIVPLKDLTTGIALRDKHMKEKYLEVAKFEDTRLEILKSALPAQPAPGVKTDVAAKGKLTLHGVTKELPFKGQVTCNAAGVCETTATLPMNINDFGIIIPKYLGVTMKPEVTVDIAFQINTK